MKAVLQRVTRASVTVKEGEPRKIGQGLVILLGITRGDDKEKADYLTSKIANLRIFEDDEGKMNRSLLDIGGSAAIVSNFTLYADCAKGRRPSFTGAARPDIAEPLYLYFIEALRGCGVSHIVTGEFGADMAVEILNDGPVTIVIDTEEILKCR